MSRYTLIAICSLLSPSIYAQQSGTLTLVEGSPPSVRINISPGYNDQYSGFHYAQMYGAQSGTLSYRFLSAPYNTSTIWTAGTRPAGNYTIVASASHGSPSLSFTWTGFSFTNITTNSPGVTNFPTPTPTPSPTPPPWTVSVNISGTIPAEMIGKTVELKDMDTGLTIAYGTIGPSGVSFDTVPSASVDQVGMYIDGKLYAVSDRANGSSTLSPDQVSFAPEGLNASYAGQQISVRDSATGAILASATIGNNGQIINPAYSYVPKETTAVDYYVGNTKVGSGVIAGSGGGGGGGSTSYAPSVTGSGVTLSASPGSSFFGKFDVEAQIIYQGGATGSGLSQGQVLWQGTIPADGLGSIMTNLALPTGTIFSVKAGIPQVSYTNMGDGVGGYVATGTNYVTASGNISSGSDTSVYVNSPVKTPGSGGPIVGMPSGSVAVGTNPVTVTNTYSGVTTNSGGSGYNFDGPAEVPIEQLMFTNADFGEAGVIARGMSLVSQVKGGVENMSSGFGKLNEAATSLATLRPPSVGGSCVLQLGPYTINIGGGVFGAARSVAGYLVALIAVFGAGRMLWDSLSA